MRSGLERERGMRLPATSRSSACVSWNCSMSRALLAPAEARVGVGHRRRATTTVALVTLLSAAALLTTSWTASSLLPAQSYRCRALLPALCHLAG